MLDEIIKKKIVTMHSNKKTFIYPLKIKVQTWRENNTLMKVFCKHHGIIILEEVIIGVLCMPKITTQCTCNTPIGLYYKSFGLHNISIEIWRGIA
jgi:hypothetical protein